MAKATIKKPGSGRPGGNPEFQGDNNPAKRRQEGPEPCNERVNARVSKSQKEKLDRIENWPKLFREWIESLPESS